MSLRKVIVETFYEVLEQTNGKLAVSELTDEVILLESGLDSLGFAILVAMLDEKIDLDPFVIMEEPIYPTNFGEFVKIYDSANNSRGESN